MNIVLWIVQGLLAVAFLLAGSMKASTPKEKLRENGMAWVDGFSAGQVRGIGLVEVLGAIGLVVPAALDIAPVLVPIAATGLVLTMLGAIATHVKLKDPFGAALPATVLLVLAAFVAVGRFWIAPF